MDCFFVNVTSFPAEFLTTIVYVTLAVFAVILLWLPNVFVFVVLLAEPGVILLPLAVTLKEGEAYGELLSWGTAFAPSKTFISVPEPVNVIVPEAFSWTVCASFDSMIVIPSLPAAPSAPSVPGFTP